MSWATIVDAETLAAAAGEVAIFDCRFDLGDPAAGRRAYDAGHIPAAVHLDLEHDLSGRLTGLNGRHPLPDRAAFATRIAEAGLNAGQQAVAYDASGGIYAARLWWMLRWLGHAEVAVLDGGWQAWALSGLPVQCSAVTPVMGNFVAGPALSHPVDADAVAAAIGRGDRLVVDARSPERFAGAPHALDAVAGHIPDAVNAFYQHNLDEHGRFRDAAALHAQWKRTLGTTSPANVIAQCGSGVTAAHNLLAMEIAGLHGAALYPGSWSEWTSDPARPIAAG